MNNNNDLRTYTLELYEKDREWAFNVNSILKVSYTEYMGLKLPLMLVTVKALDGVLQAITVGQKIEMELKIRGFTYKYKMEIIDLRSIQSVTDPKGVSTLHDLTISAIFNYEELVKSLGIKAYKNSIKKTLESLGVDVGESISDKIGDQTWLRANKSKKYMFRKLITHLFLGEKDCPVSAITQDWIKVRSLQEVMKKEPLRVANYGISDPKYLQVQVQGLNTSNATLLKKVRSDAVTMVVDKVHNNIKVLDYNGKEIDKAFGTEFKTDRKIASVNKTFIDCGNCYEDYYKAYIRNKTAWIGLQSESTYLKVPDPFSANFEVLDTLEIKTIDRGSKFKGTWVVSEVGFTLYPTIKEVKGYVKVDKIPEEYYKLQGVKK